jgi:hypothetical protein
MTEIDSRSQPQTLEGISKLIKVLPNVQKHFGIYNIKTGFVFERYGYEKSMLITSIKKITIGKTKANIGHSANHLYMRIINDETEKDRDIYLNSKEHDLIYTLNSLDNNLGYSETEKVPAQEISEKVPAQEIPIKIQKLLEFLKIDVSTLEKADGLEDYIQKMVNEHVEEVRFEDEEEFRMQVNNKGTGRYQLNYDPVKGLTAEMLKHYVREMKS